MKLTGKVISVESGSSFTDHRGRVTVRIGEADTLYRDFRLPNTEGYQLDDELTLDISPMEVAEPF